ncbi:MAG: hypothetical protein ACE5I1_28975 [bacterium]
MDCQQYTDILNVFLDGEIENLPAAAKKHAAGCTECTALTHDLNSLCECSQPLQAIALTENGKAAIIRSVRKKIVSSETKETRSVFGIVAEVLAGLRWGRAFVAVAAIVVVFAFLQFRIQETSQKTALNPEEEIEVLLEEHTLQMENSIFHTGALPTRVVATVASGRN